MLLVHGLEVPGMTYSPSAEDRERFQTQKLSVLSHLRAGNSITQKESESAYSIMRLAARVDELRREGWNVITTMVPAGEDGPLVAQYSLPPDRPRRETKYLPVVPENIPGELKVLHQWVLWRGVLRAGKISKVPYTLSGRKASSTNPDTWTSFENVMEEYSAGRSDGIGFVFAPGGGLVGVDLDHCFDEKDVIVPQAVEITRVLNSYAERSVSGKGLHVIVGGMLNKGTRKGPVEIYPHGRYFTVTGHVLEGCENLRVNQDVLERLVRLVSPKKKSQVQPLPKKSYFSNDELVLKAQAAKNGEKFSRLWSGDTSGYPSQSEADVALLAILLFWTGGDEDRASILFKKSGLYRPKWERSDYRRYCFEFLRNGGVHDGIR